MPEATIVISTFNRRRLLAEALDSALRQCDVDFEVVVVDNGSTDDTADMLARWHDARLRVIRNEHSLGGIGGRNTGIAAATGDWIGILDDDDLWAPEKLRVQINAAEAAGCHWAYAGCVHIDGQSRILSGVPPPSPAEVMRALPVRYVVPGGISNVIWRRGKLDADGLLDPRLTFPADWDLCLRLSRKGPPSAVMRPLVGYRQHGHNYSRNAAEHQAQLDILERKSADLRAGQPIDRGAQHRFVGSEELRAGSRLAALRAYFRGVVAGDWGSLPRAAGIVVPRAAHPWLRRTFLSDHAWVAQGESWLSARPSPAGADALRNR